MHAIFYRNIDIYTIMYVIYMYDYVYIHGYAHTMDLFLFLLLCIVSKTKMKRGFTPIPRLILNFFLVVSKCICISTMLGIVLACKKFGCFM